MVCYKKYLKNLINLARVSHSLVKMLKHAYLKIKIKGIWILKIIQSPSSSSTEKRLRLWLKDKNILFLQLDPQSHALLRSLTAFLWPMSVTNTGVQELSKLWCQEVSTSDQQQRLESTAVDDFIYVHTYIDQSTGKNISSWAELISILYVILCFSISIFSSPGHHDSCRWAGAENNYPSSGGNCGLQLGSQRTGVKKSITVNS